MDVAHVPSVQNRAFVTLLMVNDSYLPGCLMLAYGLAKQGSESPRVCLVTSDVSAVARDLLSYLYDEVIEVGELSVRRTERGQRQTVPRMFTRFAALRLGPDGDLGQSFDKVVLLDADLLPLRDFEALWQLPAPAALINERREHMVELDADGRIVDRPDAAKTGWWVWHDVYGSVCPHGTRIPKEITDRVASDPTNFGVNGSLFVLEPSIEEYGRLAEWLTRPEITALLEDAWTWPDMQAATLYWSGRWTSVDVSFSVFYGYPSLKAARGLHFAGVKPWSWRKKGFEQRLLRFRDHRLWARWYLEMLVDFPVLRSHRGLRRLERAIVEVLAGSGEQAPVSSDT